MHEWETGIALPGDAGADAMFAAARDVLASPAYRANARRRAERLAGIDGASNAAREVESLLGVATPAG